jgi:serine/threonine protein kinase
MVSNTVVFDEIFEYRIIDTKTGGMGEVLILERISKQQEMDFVHQKIIAAKTFIEGNNYKYNEKIFERELLIWLNFSDSIFENNKIVKLLRTTYFCNKLYALMPFYHLSVADLIAHKRQIDIYQSHLIITHIVQALKIAFERYGVVHQDLKPQNILCKKASNKQDEFHVSDWGIANIQLYSCPEIPTNKWLPLSFVEIMSNSGTLPYMSPERLIGYPSNLLADVYSIGIIYFELLFGALPFDLNTPIEEQILNGEYYNIACRALKNNFSNNSKLISFIQYCINPDLKIRYSNYRSLENDLKKLNQKWLFF